MQGLVGTSIGESSFFLAPQQHRRLLRFRRTCALSFRRSGSRWTVEIPELVDPIDAAAL